jgi:polyisoprenoid-binding protein YceI
MQRATILAIAAVAALAAGTAAAQSYTLDPDHTYPHWSVKHLGLTTFQGKFTRSSGKATIDRAARTGSVEVTIDAASSISGNDPLDKQMRGEVFFQVDKFPTITFKSTAFRFDGDRLDSIEGNLTMLGQTKPVTLSVASLRCTTHFRLKVEVCGVEARTALKRLEWGIAPRFQPPLLSDEVGLYIQAEGFRDQQ